MRRSVVGIFDSEAGARQARDELLAAGISESSVVISTNLTHDGIAAEAPGQSYENQPGQRMHQRGSGGWFGSLSGRNTRQAQRDLQYEDAVHAGSCVVSVEASSAEEAKSAEQIMARLRAVYVRECEA
jgi:hypothetical protein